VAVAYQHVREAPLPPSHHDPEVPAVADAITLKALGKHPDERYQSAEEMRADIERALDGRPIAAAPTLVAGYGAANAPTQVVSNAAGYGGGQATAGYGPPTRYQPTQYQPAAAAYADEEAEPGPRRRSDGPGGGRQKKSDKTGYIILGVVLVIAIVAAVVLANILGSGGGGAKASTVPNIVGLSVNDANAKLTSAGLKLGTSTCGTGQSSTQYPNGQILSQNPNNGAAATSGEAVNYCVSSGAQQYKMPATTDLNSRTADAVKQTLTQYGFTTITEQSTTSQTVPSGNVIDVQDTNGNSLAGKDVAVNTPIVLVVSNGKQSGNVPNVVGHQLTDAQNAITTAGFTVGGITYQNSDTYPSGTVISESPTGQQQQGTAINLVVSQGPANQNPPTDTPSATSTCTFFGLNCPSPTASASKGGGN
jgi:serine/threonine-protein kinase